MFRVAVIYINILLIVMLSAGKNGTDPYAGQTTGNSFINPAYC